MNRDRATGAFLGLAIGDALGTTVEFKDRDKFEPVTDFRGGGVFRLKPGEWTDDTSMALCLADSLLEKNEFDALDVMNRFVRWWQSGENSVNGRCFDIGTTTRGSLMRFIKNKNPMSGSVHPLDSGNGSIMRLAPVVVRWHSDRANAIHIAREQSRTTHAAPTTLEGAALLAEILFDAIATGDREKVLYPRSSSNHEINQVVSGAWKSKQRKDISSSGYVVHTLEAALWSVGQTNTFRDAVLLAVNLGDDADTVGAVTGQIAGALYGTSNIPKEWIEQLAWTDILQDKAQKLFDAGVI